jgi:CDP-diacylglycerol--glycerol-3-phosphate 3-phosphatidyltransferase
LQHPEAGRGNRAAILPNVLSAARIGILPIFILFLFQGRDLIAFLFLVAIGLSDVADGYLARRLGAVSDLGKVLDHLGDKLVSVGVLYSLSAVKGLPLWIFVAVAARELIFVVAGAIMAGRRRVFAQSNSLGKAGGICMFVSWILYIFEINPWNLYVLYASLLIMLAASLSYLKSFRWTFRAPGAEA